MRRYQEFKAWQLARDLSRKIVAMTSTGPASREFKFRDNLRDAADSAQRNFPEGFGRFSPGDFAHFLDHSRASLLEVKNAIGEGFERGYFREDDCLDADSLATHALKTLSVFSSIFVAGRSETPNGRAPAISRAEPNELNEPDELHEPDKPNEPNEPNELAEFNEPSRSSLSRLA